MIYVTRFLILVHTCRYIYLNVY